MCVCVCEGAGGGGGGGRWEQERGDARIHGNFASSALRCGDHVSWGGTRGEGAGYRQMLGTGNVLVTLQATLYNS